MSKDRRIELQQLLEKITGSKHVYFQPPESYKMTYPAIVYSRSKIKNLKANDHNYISRTSYEVLVISKDPDCEWIDAINDLPFCEHQSHFVSDSLNHDKFLLYF